MSSAKDRSHARRSRPTSLSRAPGKPARPARRGRTPLVIAALVVAVSSFAVYAGALRHDFVDWDDQDYVQENPLVLGQQYGALLTAVVSNHYHPLTMLSLALDVRNPLVARPFIATNIALHVLNALLVFWLAWRLSRRRLWVATFTALLFGIHPMHVESVAWISERKDVLYTGFFLAAAIVYLSYLERRSWVYLAATFVLFVLSCLAKEMAAAFPAVMVLLDWWTGRSLREPRAWLEKLPFVAIALLSGLIVIDLQAGRDFHGLLDIVGRHEVVLAAPPGFTALGRLTLPTYGYMMYLVRIVAPLDLCAFYPYPDPAEARSLPFLIAPLIFIATLAIAVRDLRRTRVIAFGIGWFFLTLALVLRWIPAGLVIMGDRYSYLAYIGPAFMIGMGLEKAIERRPPHRPWLLGAAAVFLAWLGALAIPQVATWRDSEALWSRVIRLQPRVGSAFLYRGKHRFNTGRIVEAQADFQGAYALGVRSGEVYGGLGISYGAQGQLDSALVMLNRAIELMPEHAALYHNRAITLVGLNRPREALADLERALTLHPVAAAPLYSTGGFAWLRLGEPERAATEFERAIAAGAADDATWFGRGNSRLLLGDSTGAAADFREALRINPRNGAAEERLRRLGRSSGIPGGS